MCLLEQCKRNEDSGSLLPLSAGKRKDEAKRRRKMPWSEESDDVFRKAHEGENEMNDLKAMTECAECTWDYIDRLRMDLAATCKERDELKKAYDAMARDLQFRTEQVRELQDENHASDRAALVTEIEKLRKQLEQTKAERDELKKELAAMRNELCYLCGKYREAHNGACDGCRWEKR